MRCAPHPWRPMAAVAGSPGCSGSPQWLPAPPRGRGAAAAPAYVHTLVDLARRLVRWAWPAWHAALAAARQEEARAAPLADRRPLTAAEAARFRKIMLPHMDDAYTLARYLSRDADIAADIVQDAYLRAYRSFPGFRGASPRAWLLTIVRNCHHNWQAGAWRERRRRAPEPMPGAQDGEDEARAVDLLADSETPESILLRRTEADAVRALLEQLPEPLREVLVLRELDELSYREIAEVAGVPVGTIMSRLSRARRLFAELWQRGEEDRP